MKDGMDQNTIKHFTHKKTFFILLHNKVLSNAIIVKT